MERRSTLSLTGVALAAVVLGTVGAPVALRPRDNQPPAGNGQATHAAPRPRDEVASGRGLELLHEFFGVHYRGGSSRPLPYELAVLIATVPDPTDSHLDWAYDSGLEAIRRAFEAEGFVIDRFWIPDPRDSVEIKIDGEPRKLARREREPGVILFRHSDPDTTKLRMLYLVPEIPTGGVYRDAFRVAVVERRAVLGHSPHLPIVALEPNRIRIIGPTFSGSALSVQLLLRGVMHPTESADIVTGSATNLQNLQTLDCPGLRLRFRATVNPDASLTEALDRLVLRPLGISGKQVAVLRESSTQYGQSVLGRQQGTDTATVTACPHALPKPSPLPSDSFLSITFPMSISSLRTEYARMPAASEPGAGPTLPTPQPKLPLDLLDPPRPKEDLPSRSALSPPTLDLLFDQMARVLQRRNIRLVGLVATDVRDKLFLADELRRRVRDLQFFTYESDVLYLRPDRRGSLVGMLVLSTYPLVEFGRWRSHLRQASSQWLAFANEGSEGVYNATRLQLDSLAPLLDYDAKTDSDSARRPPVWLTTVGNGAFLPLARMTDGTWAPHYVYRAAPEGASVSKDSAVGRRSGQGDWRSVLVYGRFLHLAVALISSLALIVLAAMSSIRDVRIWGDFRGQPGEPVPTELSELRRHVRDGSLRLHERLYSLLRLLAVGGIWLAAWALLVRRAEALHNDWLQELALVLAVIGGVSILTTAVSTSWIGFRYGRAGASYLRRLSWFRSPPTADDNGWLWLAEIVGRAAAAAFAIWFFRLSVGFALDLCRGPGRVDPFYLRASEIDSLVSPLLPLLASGAGFTAWSCWHLARIRLLQWDTSYAVASAGQPLPETAPATMERDLLARCQRAATECRRAWNTLFLIFPHATAFALLVIVGIVCLALWPEFGRTLESISVPNAGGGLSHFDWLLRLSIFASFVTTLWAALRLCAVWHALRACLDDLAGLPLFEAFGRLPPELRGLARLSLPSRTVVAGVGAVSIRQWHQLHSIHEAEGNAFANEPGGSTAVKGRLDRLMEGAEVYPRDIENDRPPEELGEKIRDLQSVLCGLWSEQPPDELAKAAAGNRPAALALWRRTAEDYLATQVAGWAEWVVGHLRVLALFLLLSLLLTTLLLYSYPFQPQGLVRLLFTLILLVTVGAILFVLTQMNRNQVLSQISGIPPGTVTWDTGFVLNLITFGVVPLLALLGSALPGFRSFLFSWAEPLIRTLAKQ